ncbi:MAG: metallopeptidase TldD-related protein [Prochlorothrix sp.]|nr:metallopeptidase TldD-related protein [Prochlorothrix sp.]
MTDSARPTWEPTFQALLDLARAHCGPDEAFQLSLWAEDSQFIRFNRAKVRQGGQVLDGALTLTWYQRGTPIHPASSPEPNSQPNPGLDRQLQASIPFTGCLDLDQPQFLQTLAYLRQTLPTVLGDPYLSWPQGNAHSHTTYPGQLLSPSEAASAILEPVADLDFVGLYAAGCCVRAQADSAGQYHWFQTETFNLDYSCWDSQGQAVKGSYAGKTWDQAVYQVAIQRDRQQLQQLQCPRKSIPRGRYRTYFAPAAVAALLDAASGAWSEKSLQTGESPLVPLRRSKKAPASPPPPPNPQAHSLSPLLTLREDFGLGLVPAFNDRGELAPKTLDLITAGTLAHTLISTRTAQEYGLSSNGAAGGEWLRSPEILAGTLEEPRILDTLDEGLYISNLHYLNWSDRSAGRLTGMTRYACFWVEGGEIVAPIENLRFDDSLDRFWGENLVAFTQNREIIPETGTYGRRALGGMRVPGMLVNDFIYTL